MAVDREDLGGEQQGFLAVAVDQPDIGVDVGNFVVGIDIEIQLQIAVVAEFGNYPPDTLMRAGIT